MALHNRINNRILKQKLHTTPQDRSTLSFYKYAHVDDPAYWRDQLYIGLSALETLGRIYIATEGVNAQVSVPRSRVDEFRKYIDSIPFLTGVRLNFAVEDNGRSEERRVGKEYSIRLAELPARQDER